MKVSVCITVFNEEGSVGELLSSLLAQSKKADEIVIVDGGSSDKTVNIIRHYQKKSSKIKLLIEPGNIAHGRNTAIEIARNEIIATTDAGCIVKKDWLEKITEPFENSDIYFVAGFYVMTGVTPVQKAIAVFHGIPPERFNSTTFLPSARSISFRKKVWEDVGGFCENLSGAGEDTLFNVEAIKKGYKPVRVKDALVYWQVPKNLKESFKKFLNYARGDAESGIWFHPTKGLASHNVRILFVFLRYLLAITLLVYSIKHTPLFWLVVFGFFVYLFWSIWKWRDVLVKWQERVWVPVIQVSSDFAVMAGFLTGWCNIIFPKK